MKTKIVALAATAAAVLGFAANALAAVVDLSAVTADTTLAAGDTATGVLGGPYKISIADGATVTLSDAIITNRASGSTPWAGITCLGNATIILDGESAVNSCNEYQPGIYVPESCTLTIRGDGSIDAEGGRLGGAGIGGGAYGWDCGNIVIDIGDDASCGIYAVGGGFSAGIGGGLQSDCGCITISNGYVYAESSGGGAGIGSSNGGTCGDINICGGDVDACGSDGGAGVGSGAAGSCGDITICGRGSLEATGGDGAAGIGSGDGSYDTADCGDITITGGDVTATGGENAAGIGTGNESYCGNITIGPRISSVDATRGDGTAAPIGAGYNGECGEISIYKGLKDETTQDGDNRTLLRVDCNLAEIDDSVFCDDGTVYINENARLFGELDRCYMYKITIADGVTVTLDGAVITNNASVADNKDYSWAGITLEGSAEIILAEGSTNIVRGFYRYYPGIEVTYGEELTISGSGALFASSNGDGAGIGGCCGEYGGNIVINGGDITAVGGDSAAGIGSAYDGQFDTITINGGNVVATGGGGAAGIGGGEEAEINNIEINGGVVSAVGGLGGAGIGGGQGASASTGDIRINGGTVTATGGGGAPGIGGDGGTVWVEQEITRVIATCGTGAVKPIDVCNDDDIAIDIGLVDKLSADGKTRTLTGTGGSSNWYETWAEANGLSGADAAWDAAPAAWGGKWQNAFIFMYGEGLLDGSTPLMTITIDDDGDPYVETPPALSGREGFFEIDVIGSSAVDDWATPVYLEGDSEYCTWHLPEGESANFFRARLSR